MGLPKSSLRLLILLLLSFPVTSCKIYLEESLVSTTYQSYSIDTEKILDDIQQIGSEVFTPQELSIYEIDIIPEKYMDWEVDDYFLIANALHTLAWSESLESWNLHLFSLGWDCNELDKGPQWAFFIYFKNGKIKDRESRFVSTITLEPLRNSVAIHKEEIYPKIMNWSIINLEKFPVSIEDTIKIAENNGGSEIRENLSNKCDISLAMEIGSLEYDGWRVSYSNNEGRLLVFKINPNTGKLEK